MVVDAHGRAGLSLPQQPRDGSGCQAHEIEDRRDQKLNQPEGAILHKRRHSGIFLYRLRHFVENLQFLSLLKIL